MQFRIEHVLVHAGNAQVMARSLESGDFALTNHATLGGVPIRPVVTSPRALRDDGTPDLDVFVFLLQRASDAACLVVGQTVTLSPS